MKSLSKIDLEPNEIYNVSLNIKQGNKTVDNLRFFQTKVPKLFNIKPANFFTTSQITNEPDAVVQTQTSSGITGGAPVTLNVTSVSWKVNKNGDYSEGELTLSPTQLSYDFTIRLSGPPKMLGYQVSGFAGSLDFLNYRNDYQPSGNSIKVSLTLSQIDPTAERKVLDQSAAKTFTLTKKINKGDTIVQASGLKGLVPGKTKLGGSTSTADSSTGTFENPTYVSGYTPGQNTFTTTRGARVAQSNGTNISVTNTVKINGFNGAAFAYLGLTDDTKYASSSPNVVDAQFKHQTFPSYGTPTYRYTFGQNSFIKSSVINPNVLESLVWEDTVRDFIFFVIADGNQTTKYFFGTYGTITPAIIDGSTTSLLTGNSVFNKNNPPSAPGLILDENAKGFDPQTPKIKFFDATGSNTTGVVPPLRRPVKVQFAIARYTKKGSTWSGEWLGAKKDAPIETDILSSPEALD
jgi:hypothetical protein